MNVRSRQCSETEVASFEADLRAKGMRLSSKTNEKDLLPGEYIRRVHTGSAKSFEGAKIYTFLWCLPG